MKTFFEKLIQRIDFITHPAASRLAQKPEGQSKRKTSQPISIKNAVSPDRFAMRSPSKKQQSLRRTPAP